MLAQLYSHNPYLVSHLLHHILLQLLDYKWILLQNIIKDFVLHLLWSPTATFAYPNFFLIIIHSSSVCSGTRSQLKCDGTRAKTRFRLSAKRTSPFKSAGASVQSTAGSRGVCISSSNAGYTNVPRQCEGYWLPTPFASFPYTSPPVRHRVPSHFNWSLTSAMKAVFLHVSFDNVLLTGCCDSCAKLVALHAPQCTVLWISLIWPATYRGGGTFFS